MTLTVRLLGPLTVHVGTHPITLTKDAARLLAYLVLQREPATFKQAASAIDATHYAQIELSKAICALRTAVGEPYLLTSATTLTLTHVSLDTAEFEMLSRLPSPTARAQALALYRGDLLEGFSAEWLLSQRMILREQRIELLYQQLDYFVTQFDWHAALEIAKQLVEAEPLDETAHQWLIRIYAHINQPATALAHFAKLTKLLKQELAIGPLPATVALASALHRTAPQKISRLLA